MIILRPVLDLSLIMIDSIEIFLYRIPWLCRRMDDDVENMYERFGMRMQILVMRGEKKGEKV